MAAIDKVNASAAVIGGAALFFTVEHAFKVSDARFVVEQIAGPEPAL